MVAIRAYAIRRAYYCDIVRRSDLVSNFGLSASTASRAMSNLDALTEVDFGDGRGKVRSLLRRERDLVSLFGLQAPPGHDGARILKEILLSIPGEERLGFEAKDSCKNNERGCLELHAWRFRALDLPKDIDYSTLLKALISKTPVSIDYVGMKVGDNSRRRTILPLAVHLIEGQMMVHGYDLGLTPPAPRAYVIYRISAVAPVTVTPAMADTVERLLKTAPGRLAKKTYQITLNPKLSADQVSAFRRELGLNDQMRVQMYPDLEYHLRRFYMSSHEESPGKDIVWPIIVNIEEVR